MVTYLASVAQISAADGEITTEEAKTIESIRREIGATADDLKNALHAVAPKKSPKLCIAITAPATAPSSSTVS